MKQEKRVYIFKPMKGLTFWARLLMGIEIAGLLLWAAAMAGSMLKGQADIIITLTLLVGILLACLGIIIAGIVSLIWIYGATRNAHTLRPNATITSPAWAVGWFFIPIMGLYKPYETLRDVWIASHGPVNGKYPKGYPLIPVWWWTFVISNIVLRIGQNDTSGDESLIYLQTAGNWATVAGLVLLAISTLAFFILTGQINRNQLRGNTQISNLF